MKHPVRHLIIPLCIAVLLISCMPAVLFAEDSQITDEALTDLQIFRHPKYGSICIKIPTDEFNALGYSYGDSVNITFSNGYSLQDLPYYNGYYVAPGEPMLRGVAGDTAIRACFNYGDDLWETAGLSEQDTASISLYEKGKYLGIQEASNLQHSNDRSEYSSDEVFANFRCVTGGSLKKDFLYRSASPCDNKSNRAPYADRLISDAGVRFALNLSDEEERMRIHIEKDDFDSPYYLSLYEEGKVAFADLALNYTSDDFRSSLIAGLQAMAHNSGPYLVHCREGKDRTGFVCMLLEGLAGCSYDEIIEDYMLTYQNYYGITKENNPEKYRLIQDINILPMLSFLTGEENANLSTADYHAGAVRYLRDGGMSDEDIELLKSMITN